MSIARRIGRRWTAVAVTAATASVLAVPAAASTDGVTARETVCSQGQSVCNSTYGSGNSVYEIVAGRNRNATGEIGFFELFGPGAYKKTGPTNREVDHTFPVNASFPRNSLLCVSFWRKNSDGSFTKVGGNACTSTPIG